MTFRSCTPNGERYAGKSAGRRWRAALAVVAAALCFPGVATSAVTQSLMDGFGDGDRNNNGTITVYDTDINLTGTLNDAILDLQLNVIEGITEVTAAEDAADVGVAWFSTNAFTGSGDPKANLKIIDDVVTNANNPTVHNSYALGYEGKGGGSQAVGVFPESIVLGPNVGDRVVVKFDIRIWGHPVNLTDPPPDPAQLRWGLFQDTDGDLDANGGTGSPDSVGNGGAVVTWGRGDGENDGDWRSNSPGPEGDRGIWTRTPIGDTVSASGDAHADTARINYEYNLLNINGTSNNARFLEGSGVSDTFGSGGDVGTVASPGSGNGPGGTISDLSILHSLKLEILRVPATGNSTGVEAAAFIDGLEILRDAIKTTDTGAAVLGPPPESFDYIALRNTRNSSAGVNPDIQDFDFVIDNFMIQSIAIPEPASGVLLVLGGCLLGVRRRR